MLPLAAHTRIGIGMIRTNDNIAKKQLTVAIDDLR